MKNAYYQSLLHIRITYLAFKIPQAFSHLRPIQFDFWGVRSNINIFQNYKVTLMYSNALESLI